MEPNWKNKKITVTGGAGFIGSHTCEFLLEQGAHVQAIDDLRTGSFQNLASINKHPNFSFVLLDIHEKHLLDDVIHGFQPDAIIHLAALVSVPQSIENPEENFQQNIVSTHLLIEAARSNKISKIVFASSSAIYGDTQEMPLTEQMIPYPLSPYGAAKIASEQLFQAAARSYGISVTAQRYFNVFGPRQDPSSPYSGVISIFLDKMSKGSAPLIYGDGEQTRDFIYVKDVARANALACLSTDLPFQAHNISTGKRISLNELAKTFATHFPDSPVPQYAEARSGDILHSCGSNQLAQKNIGFTPEYSFEEGLAALIETQKADNSVAL